LTLDSGGGIRLRAKGGAIYLFTGCLGAKTLYIHDTWICEALQVGFEALNLNHDVSTADRLVPTLKFLKIDPTRLRGGVRLRSWCHIPIAYQGAETLLYIHVWICEALKVGFEGQP
jgi:hypothetical protein